AKLKAAADKFTAENRKLTKYHRMVAEKVVQLMNIDLLLEKQKWLDNIKSIKQIFQQLEREGYQRMEAWKTHWDYQIYKALEHQYQKGLEGINENLPEIRVNLVFKERQLQFSPPFEKVKETYFNKIKEFISFPQEFKG